MDYELKITIEKLANYLELDVVPVEFRDMAEDSMLVLKPKIKIEINKKFENDLIKRYENLAYQYRRLFQICLAKVSDLEIVKTWKKELENVLINEDNTLKQIDIDCYAFSQKFVNEKFFATIKHPNPEVQKVIDLYKENNYELL